MSTHPTKLDGFELERPKEHGAYAMLGVPLLSALLIAGPTWIAVAVIVASVLGFIAHEPIMVATGRRGPRAKRDSPQAAARATVLLLITVALGTSALWIADTAQRLALLACLLTALVSFSLSALGMQRQLIAQLWSSLGLTMPSLVVLLAGGIETTRASLLCIAWVIGQSVALIAVRSVIAQGKKATQGTVPLLNDVLQFGLSLFALGGIVTGFAMFNYMTPMLFLAAGLRFFPPSLKHLRRVGWTLMIANLLSASWMVIAERSL